MEWKRKGNFIEGKNNTFFYIDSLCKINTVWLLPIKQITALLNNFMELFTNTQEL